MIERRQLPGIVRIGRRVLLRADDLLNWLNQKSAPSPRSQQRWPSLQTWGDQIKGKLAEEAKKAAMQLLLKAASGGAG
jgi:hypothetical protein